MKRTNIKAAGRNNINL